MVWLQGSHVPIVLPWFVGAGSGYALKFISSCDPCIYSAETFEAFHMKKSVFCEYHRHSKVMETTSCYFKISLVVVCLAEYSFSIYISQENKSLNNGVSSCGKKKREMRSTSQSTEDKLTYEAVEGGNGRSRRVLAPHNWRVLWYLLHTANLVLKFGSCRWTDRNVLIVNNSAVLPTLNWELHWAGRFLFC